jgi:hypothetical protein
MLGGFLAQLRADDAIGDDGGNDDRDNRAQAEQGEGARRDAGAETAEACTPRHRQ